VKNHQEKTAISEASEKRRGGVGLANIPAELSLDVQASLLSFPGPALVVDSRLMAVSMNKMGETLSHLLSKGPEVKGAETFRAAIREASILDMPAEARIEFLDTTDEPLRRTFDVSVLPCVSGASTGNTVFVLGRETTLESSITEALVQSRELFQDLLKCSSDFAWETNHEGRFEFVSARASIAFSAEKLSGEFAETLIDREQSEIAENWSPFLVKFPIEDVELWLNGEDGQSHCMLLTSVPILTEEGHFTGSRGACVDITELRRNERLVKNARRREDLVGRIVATIRAEFDPLAMLQTAALEIGDVFDADFGCILTQSAKKEGFDIGGTTLESEISEDIILGEAVAAIKPPDLEVSQDASRTVKIDLAGHRGLVCGTMFGGQIIGGLVIGRASDAPEWNQEDHLLLEHIASHMGIAMAQAAHAVALERLSRVEEMTGLLNRRAFFQDAGLCLARNERSNCPATFVYLDLDNFKSVNDTLGHAQGDRVLVEFANVLHDLIRRNDLAVRLGGDEFGLLLDNCSAEDAVKKTQLILGKLSEIVSDLELPSDLSVSAGIAGWAPGDSQNVEMLVDQADKALYEAKRAGKSGWRVAID
jgi:diguanylate cyclase (GGDEF)-like protein